MFVIRPQLMEAFEQAACDEFIFRVCDYLRRHHARAVAAYSDDQLEPMVRVGVRRARSRGLTLENKIGFYVALMFEIAPNFDEHPAVRELLGAGENVDASMDLLPVHISEEQWQEANDQADPRVWGGMIMLEPIAFTHAPAMQELASDPEVGRTCWLPVPYPKNGSESWIAEQAMAWKSGEAYSFAVMEPSHGFVGCCSLPAVQHDYASCALSFWIGRPYWNRGYATQAAGLAIQYAISTLHLRHFSSSALDTNRASRRVLEKLGFQLISSTPNEHPKFPLGVPMDHYYQYCSPE